MDGKGEGEIIIYRTDDGADELQLRLVDGTVWLTQAEIATLLESTKQNVSHHIREILAEGELTEAATVKDYLTVQTEGSREVRLEQEARRLSRPAAETRRRVIKK